MPRTFWKPDPGKVVFRLTVAAGATPLAGLAAAYYWPLDLLNHFQMQYAVAAGCGVLVLLALRRFKLALLALPFLAVPLVRLSPYFMPPPAAAEGRVLRALTFNVLGSNKLHAETVWWVRGMDPDIAFFPETGADWAESLRALSDTHPHRVEHILEDNFGFVLVSKHPLGKPEIRPCGRMELPMLIVSVHPPDGPDFLLIGAHPVPPVTRFWAEERDAFLAEISRETTAADGPVIVLGDLNASRWSHGMRPLFQSGLRDTAEGRGFSATWMRENPLAAIAIDHIMVKGGISVTGHEVGPDLGSDHRPVTADLRMP